MENGCLSTDKGFLGFPGCTQRSQRAICAKSYPVAMILMTNESQMRNIVHALSRNPKGR
jgi:hypothetical protein